MFTFHLVGLLTSIAVLVWGADKFVDNSSLLAKKLGMSELTIGLTIVALGTSAPEIFVGISSVINNSEELAMGTVVGSNISNIALIFGVSCIGINIKPSKTSFIQFLPFLLGAILLGLSLQDLKITSYESITFVLLFFLFILITYKFKSHEDTSPLIEDQDSPISNTSLFLAIGLIALIGGSHFAVIHAESIAILLNVPQLIIGLTIIAIGTSLPELAATISAITKNKNDMVIGNVIGSNVMNIALVVPILGFFSNTSLHPTIYSRDYLVMLLVTLLFVLVATMYSSKYFGIKTIRLIGCCFVLGYFIYILNISNLI
ncbi:calcium/sodium antiporter [Gammaproteobacteria bacterium]|nr:calcium/sodium antiporter [Gammaproteobacteria bacterium]